MRQLAHRLAQRVARLTGPRTDEVPSVPMGRGSYGNPKVLSWGEGATLCIGSFCSIAANVTIVLGGEHRTDWVTTYPFNVRWESAKSCTGHPRSKGNVTVEHDVWLGYGAVLLSGVTLHTGAVVGCNAVVSRDVPAYTIVAGNPAKLVRQRFDDETIVRLLATKWWERTDEEISRLMPALLGSDIDYFLREAGG
jgi:acetyltransferase-like isoleucine patch superfamily enzyme